MIFRREFIKQCLGSLSFLGIFPFLRHIQKPSDKLPFEYNGEYLITKDGDIYRLKDSVDWSIQHVQDAKWDLVQRNMKILENDFLKKYGIKGETEANV